MQTRPAVKILVPYLVGIILADRFNFSPAYLWVLTAILVISAFIAYKKRWLSFGSVMLMLSFLLIGLLRYEMAMLPPRGIDKILHQQVKILGIVLESEKESTGGSSLILKGDAVSVSDPAVAITGRISVRMWDDHIPLFDDNVRSLENYNLPYRYGDVVKLEGLLTQPRSPRNPGVFDYRKYMARRGVFVTVSVDNRADIQRIGVGGNLFLRWVRELRRKVETAIDETMPRARWDIFKDINLDWHLREIVLSTHKSAPILKGIILGERSELPLELYQAFRRTSTTHILVVSGMNMAIIAGWTFLIFNWFRRFIGSLGVRSSIIEYRSTAYIPAIPIVVIYACMAGLYTSVSRASIFIVLTILALLVNRDTDLFNILAIAALGILTLSPGAFWDVGFQLSFGAVGSITYLMTYWQTLFAGIKRDKWYQHAIYRSLQSIAVSWSAQVGAMLIIAYAFHKATLVGILVNPIIIPLVALVTPIGFIQCLAGLIYLPLAALLGYVNHILISLMISIVSYFAKFRFAELPVREFSLLHIIVISAVVVFIVNLPMLLKEKRKLIIASAGVIAASIWAAALSYDGHILRVTYLDVGQGDSIFVDMPDGRNILIDGGPCSGVFDAGERMVSPFLQHEGVGRLDLLVSTHPHDDHAGGLNYIVDNYSVCEAITGKYELSSSTYDRFCSRLDRNGISHRDAHADVIFKDDELCIEILGPQEPDTSGNINGRMNNNSVVIKTSYRGVSFLFPGDIGEESEHLLINSGRDTRADVLKVPHHGSEISSSWEFLQAVQPYVGVISVGRPNIANLPSPMIIERYMRLGIKTYRTDMQGAVTVVTDGRRGWIRTMSY